MASSKFIGASTLGIYRFQATALYWGGVMSSPVNGKFIDPMRTQRLAPVFSPIDRERYVKRILLQCGGV
jgi:hypothetical protein